MTYYYAGETGELMGTPGAGMIPPAALAGGFVPAQAVMVDTTQSVLAALLGGGAGAAAQILTTPQPATQIAAGAFPGIAAAIPAAAGALGLSLPAWLAAILGAGVAGYGAYQALGGGEGGGIGGLNILGGDVFAIGGVPFGGPGLPEPPASMVVKEWRANNAQFYLLTNGKIAVYSRAKKRWKVYRPAKNAVIGKNMPSHKNLVRLRRYMKKQVADARTILQIGSPATFARLKPKKHYHRYARRRN